MKFDFPSACGGERPVRLCEATRRFAWESLHFKYGLDAKKTPCVSLDDVENFDSLGALDKHDLAIERVVREAPVRICDGERLSGAATLFAAVEGCVPAKRGGKVVCYGLSHLTLDFQKVLDKGWNGILDEVRDSPARNGDERQKRFLRSCEHCINCLKIWRDRYLDALKGKCGYEANYENLLRVPFEPPETFAQALQSVWFTFAFERLCGVWPGIGRLDKMLGPYLAKDLAAGAITPDDARELLAHFLIKGCEWITGGDSLWGSGDAQHYQNLVLSGIDEAGNEVTNDVTYLILDVLEELGISDFPTTMRLNSRSPRKLLRRVSEVVRRGGGIVAVYNEDKILEAMTRYGYPREEAVNFANDGCWEVQVPGKTMFGYMPFDSLQILQHRTLADCSAHFDSFEDLLDAYKSELRAKVERMTAARRAEVVVDPSLPVAEQKWKSDPCCTVVSLLEEGCIESGLPYYEGGAVYNVSSPHIGGLPDTVNSLYAIKKLVFDDKLVSFDGLMKQLRNDWPDEKLRQRALTKYSYFGNDNDEVDLLAADLLDSFADACAAEDGKSKLAFPPGVSTFGRQIDWLPYRMATPFGARRGTILSGNMSPTPGTDTEGATAIVKSYCKSDMSRLTTGAALDIHLHPSAVEGEDGLAALEGLIDGFLRLGGFFMQIDVVDAAVLRDAQEHPENHLTLSVRVSGWNARFVTLTKEWQDMVIERDSK